MRKFVLAAAILASASVTLNAPAVAQSRSDEARFDAAQSRFDRELAAYRAEIDRYRAARGGDRRGYRDDYRRPGSDNGRYYDDRDEGDYDPVTYYRDGPSYRERTLASDDRVYRGSDGRYYCRRSDGTTGLIVGAAAGGVLGNVIDGGRSRTVGTILGAAVGAVTGRAVEQNNNAVRCR